MGMRLGPQVVPVLSDPPVNWTGARGRLSSEVFDRHLPGDIRRWQFAVCGPPGLVDATFTALAESGSRPNGSTPNG